MDPFVLCSTFNEDAANYDRWRPRYVPELFAAVFQYAGPPGKALEPAKPRNLFCRRAGR